MPVENLTPVCVLKQKVRKWTLPVFRGQPEPGLFGPKRLLLPQGELAQFYDGEEGMRYLAFVELLPEAIRGNHYHQRKQEWIYIISGELLLILEDVQSRDRDSLPLQAGDLAFIPTGVAHALRTMRPGQAVEFSPVRFDPQDIQPYSVA